ncbi:YbgA family protein [Pontibacillus salicampi]|uniref:YbgA family protein n=1 Tax=Pontibacillus salicampi TaxID=1449801 RepID=A0ABV6LRV3_9BACI
MKTFATPKIVVSKCLEFDHVRYNGEVIPDKVVQRLTPHVQFIPVCPEMEIGLGVPRDVIRIVRKGEEERLMQPSTERDLTESMNAFSKGFLESLQGVDGFLLKNRSPTCGTQDVKMYDKLEKSPVTGKTKGLFAKHVIEHYPGLAIEEEGRLKNYKIREHFFTKLFTLAEYRQLRESPSMKKLVHFHSKHKYLFMSYNQTTLKDMGRITANHEKLPIEEVLNSYEERLHWMFRRLPSRKSNVNVCQHIMGYFKHELTKGEKNYFQETLQKFYEERIPLSAILSILKSWVVRFQNEYLLEQTYFEPYPEDLIEISDSGKGRSFA